MELTDGEAVKALRAEIDTMVPRLTDQSAPAPAPASSSLFIEVRKAIGMAISDTRGQRP